MSTLGRVRSVDRTVMGPQGPRRLRGRPMRVWPDPNGYRRVALSSDGVVRTHYVHTLVLEAFVGPRPDGAEACHYDDDKGNNRLTNLRWGTTADNATDRERNRRLFGSPAEREASLAGHACEEACLAAASDVSVCTCACSGRNHGSERVTYGPAAAEREGQRLRRLVLASALASACACDRTHGQSCPWCDGTNAELGVTPPPPGLPGPAAWAAPRWPDPWHAPADHPQPPPF